MDGHEDVRSRLTSIAAAWDISLDTLGVIEALPSLESSPPATAVRIYLDLNHWVALAKAKVGRADGQPFIACYQRLLEGVHQGDLVTPLSSAHYMELTKIRNVRQRTNLADVMCELSQFDTLAAYGCRIRIELEAAFYARFGYPTPEPDQPVLGRGVGFAFDLGDGVLSRRIQSSPWDWFLTRPASGLTLAQAQQLRHTLSMFKEYLLLRGPRPEDVAHMPDYHPEVAQRSTGEHVRREQAFADLLNREPSPGEQLDDALYARYLYWELQPALPELLMRTGISKEAFMAHDKKWLTDLVDDLPTAVVHMGLARQSFKNASRPWSPNDVRDIDALSGAVPHCDIVVTEKHARDVLTRSGLAERYSTIVISRLAELETYLKT